MQKIRTFFYSLFKSSTSPVYYNDVLKAPLSFSWKYFFFFNTLFSLIFIIPLTLGLSSLNFQEIANNLIEAYPSDLVLSLRSGKLSINQPLPYTLDSFATFTSDEDIQKPSQVLDYKTPIVVTESTIYTLSDSNSGQVRYFAIPETSPDFTVDKSVVDLFVARILDYPFFKYKLYLPLLLLFGIIIIFPSLLAYRLLTISFYSVIVFLLSKILLSKLKLTFSKVFQVCIHSLSPVIIIAFLSSFTPVPISGFLFLLIFLVWTLLCLFSVKTAKSGKTVKIKKGK